MQGGVIGQERAQRIVRSAIASGRVPHAWLLTGPEGVGKDALAIEIAKTLRCEHPLENGTVPCNACKGCMTTAALQNPNVRFVFALPTGKGEDGRNDPPLLKLSDSELGVIQEQLRLKAADPYHNISIPRATQIKISSIREVRRDVTFAAAEPGWRVVIVSEAHQMGTEAANAFLKTLEEPAPNTLLILTTSNREAMLATIRSRCQEIRLDPLPAETIINALVERDGAEQTAAALAAHLSSGSLSRARESLAGDLGAVRHDVVQFLRAALRRSPLALHGEIERIISNNDRAQAERFLSLLTLWVRDVWSLRLTGREEQVINRDQLDDIRSFNTKFGDAPLELLMEHVSSAIRAVRANAHLGLTFTVLGMRFVDACYAPSGR